MYIKVHLYNYVTGLVTRQILFDKYNSMISLSEMYTAFPFFELTELPWPKRLLTEGSSVV